MVVVLLLLVISVVTVFTFMGCKNEDLSESETVVSETVVEEEIDEVAEEVIIAYSPLSMEVAYFKSVVKFMQDTADEIGGIKFVIGDPQADAAKQATIIEDLITMGADAIIVYAIDNKTIPASVDYAHEKGVKIISHISSFENADITVALDEYEFGYISGEAAGKYITENMEGKAEIAMLDLDTMGGNKVLRSKGVVDAIAEFAPEAEIVARASAFTEEKALDTVENMLTENPNINFLVAGNDSGAYGAIAAIESKGLLDQVMIACIGNEKRTLEYIVDGKILWTVDSGAEATGIIIINHIYSMLTGEDYDDDIVVPVALVTTEIAKEQLNK